MAGYLDILRDEIEHVIRAVVAGKSPELGCMNHSPPVLVNRL